MNNLRRLTCAFVVLTATALAAATVAGAETVSQTIPLTYEGTNPCMAFEPFAGTGTLHSTTSENLSTSGTLRYYLDTRVDGLQAVTPTGKRYIVQDVYYHQFVFSGAAEDTFDITAHFVRVGDDGTLVTGDDFYEYLRTHITTNAAGLVTAVTVNTSPKPCQ